ncbi:MAG: sodium:proton antiporter, partial [Haliea sp.]
MEFAVWSTIVGALLILMALGSTVLMRLPLSTAMLYLAVGVAVSPLGLKLLWANPLGDAALLEHLTELVVLVSLFVAGLKLSPGLRDRSWLLPLRLALTS